MLFRPVFTKFFALQLSLLLALGLSSAALLLLAAVPIAPPRPSLPDMMLC